MLSYFREIESVGGVILRKALMTEVRQAFILAGKSRTETKLKLSLGRQCNHLGNRNDRPS